MQVHAGAALGNDRYANAGLSIEQRRNFGAGESRLRARRSGKAGCGYPADEGRRFMGPPYRSVF
jgi:hypothetical protein